MPHGRRAFGSRVEPVLVTMKVLPEIWGLRARGVIRRILPALHAARDHLGMRLVQYSVQRDHIHLIVEARDRASLARAMQGLSVRIARAIHRTMQRTGRVFADRYHSRVLSSPRQVKHALEYVLCNATKHRALMPWQRFDPCSSAASFDGWRDEPPPLPGITAAPRSWLLTVGWRRHGLLDPSAVPGRREA